ncbi:amino acid ABC transporter substrate-binding protein, PAAT family [Mesorhizobium australicum]|uniref:Amino acid ABC transporter substrate-binding protein, PAAT family n=2 Tax=Mesorhizobium australicum TaxID=536018 RepID=A0A1X7P0D7_9HYPH|nr:amino acid ABC transporter substrate-binding protein, PAAT family [Mesorhizobium australicum]
MGPRKKRMNMIDRLRRARPWCLLLALLALATVASAQDAPSPSSSPAATLKVGVYEHPPFVMARDGGYTGMAVDLWNKLATTLDFKVEYIPYGTLRDLVEAVSRNEVDAAVTNLTITRDRAERIDFTHPWFDAGLRVMTRDAQGAGFWGLVDGLQQSGHLRAYGWIALVIVAATIMLTLFDRRFDQDFPRRWRDGIAESFYTVMSIATSGKPPARQNLFGWVGRLWQGLWLVCGIAVLAYVTSSVTSVMTTLSLTGQINSVADLPGRPIGVFTGSVSEEYARSNGLNLRSFPNIDEAAEALADQRIDAIIGDAPVLEYYATSHPDQAVSVVGAIFEPDKYGFALPLHHPLTRQLSVEIIGAHERGQIAEIRQRYFGESP